MNYRDDKVNEVEVVQDALAMMDTQLRSMCEEDDQLKDIMEEAAAANQSQDTQLHDQIANEISVGSEHFEPLTDKHQTEEILDLPTSKARCTLLWCLVSPIESTKRFKKQVEVSSSTMFHDLCP